MNLTNEVNSLVASAWSDLERTVASRNTHETELALQRIKKIEALKADLGLHPNGQTTTAKQESNAALAADEDWDTFVSRRRQRSKRPTSIKIAGAPFLISKLNEVPIAIGNWILNQGRELTELPRFVQQSSSGFYPSAKLRTLKNGWHIEIGDDQSKLFEKARRLLNTSGFSEIDVEVNFEDGTKAML